MRLASGDAVDADYEAFSAWLSEDLQNMSAFAEVEGVAGRIDALRRENHAGLDRLMEGAVVTSPITRFIRLRLVWSGVIAAIAAAMLVFMVIGIAPQFSSAKEALYAADATSIKSVTLADGSTVLLGPGAEMSVSFERQRRAITSFKGIGFFSVQHDAKRPFVVALGSREIRVTGTEFEVSAFNDVHSVSVAKGAVTVSDAHAAKARANVSLSPGQSVTFSPETSNGVKREVAAADIGVWRKGFLEFREAPLGDVADKLNGFYGGPVFSLANEDVAAIRFSGVLVLSDAQGTARRLSELMPKISAVETEGGFRLSLNEGH